MHDLAVFVKEEHPFARNLFLKNSADIYLLSCLTLPHSVPLLFLSQFEAISSNTDEVL